MLRTEVRLKTGRKQPSSPKSDTTETDIPTSRPDFDESDGTLPSTPKSIDADNPVSIVDSDFTPS